MGGTPCEAACEKHVAWRACGACIRNAWRMTYEREQRAGGGKRDAAVGVPSRGARFAYTHRRRLKSNADQRAPCPAPSAVRSATMLRLTAPLLGGVHEPNRRQAATPISEAVHEARLLHNRLPPNPSRSTRAACAAKSLLPRRA